MSEPLITRLETIAGLDAEDREALRDLARNTRPVAAKRDIVSEGERPEHLNLIVEGWAARYKVLPDGARQITSFLVPGDFCDLHVTILARMDHGIVAITDCQVAEIDGAVLEALTSASVRLTRALWWSTLVEEAIVREWVVNVGRRDAYQALAHLLCELHVKMKLAGLIEDGEFSLPLTQEDLADATAMTPVHLNRTIQRLRADGLIELSQRQLHIPDVEALRRAGGFNPAYFHIVARNPNG